MTKTISNNIRKIRQLKGYSQEYVADKLNLTQGGFGRIERAEVRVSIATLNKLSEIFEMSVQAIQNFHEKDLYKSGPESENFKDTGDDNYLKHVIELVKCKEEIIYLKKLVENLEMRIRDKDEIIQLLKKQELNP